MSSSFNNFAGVTIKLDANIDLGGKEWTSIRYFAGNFDGCGYTISNLTIDNATLDYVGLFGYVTGTSDIGNFNMTNVKVNAQHWVGGVVGYSPFGSKLSLHDITITGIDVSGRWYTGGVAGNVAGPNHKITNCTVIGTEEAHSVTGARYEGSDVSGGVQTGGVIGFAAYSTVTSCTAKNLEITGAQYVGGVVGSGSNDTPGKILHKNNTAEDITIIAKSEEGRTSYGAGAIFGMDAFEGDGSDTGNTFKNVTIQITDPDGSNPQDVPVTYIGNVVAKGEDLETPLGQIVDADGNTYASFSDLQNAVNFYDAKSDGKSVDLLNDVTLENPLVVPEDVELNTNDKNLTGDVTSENGSVTLNGVTFTGAEGEDLTLTLENSAVQDLTNITEITVGENGGTILVGDMVYNAASGDTKITVDPETGNLNITPGVGDSMIVNGVETTPTQDVVINPEGDVNTQIYQEGKNIIFNMGQAVEGVKYSFQTKLTSKADRFWKDAGKITIDQNGDIIVTVKASAFRNNQEYDYRLVADDVAQYGDMLTVSTLARPSWKAQVVDTIHFNVTPKAIDANAQELKVTYRTKVNNNWSNWTETTLNTLMDEGIVTLQDGVYTATAPDNMAGTQIQFKVYAEGGLKGQTLYLDSNSANGSISLKKPAKLSTPSIKVSFTKETISLKDVKNAALVDYQYEIKIGLSKSNMTTMVYASDSTLINAMRDGDFDTFVTELGLKDYAGERVYFSLTALSVNTVSYMNSSATSTMWNLRNVTF